MSKKITRRYNKKGLSLKITKRENDKRILRINK